MPTKQLYDTWMERILQLGYRLRATQRRNLVWLMLGIYLEGSVYLSQVAVHLPGKAVVLSKERQLRRLLDNPTLRVRPLYEPVALQLLLSQAIRTGIRLVIDSSKVGSGHQLLMVALASRRRAVPIAWTWLDTKKGHSSALKQLALLAYVHKLVPEGVQVVLVGDTEFEAGELQAQLTAWGWGYVLRQKANNQVQREPDGLWQRFGDLVSRPGESCWLSEVHLTRRHAQPVNLLAHWEPEEQEAWLLATNLSSRQATLQAYRRRMWIEAMFGDLKKKGFDLESTRLKHFERLSRLTLAVALLYVWCFLTGARVIKDGLRYLVDRKDRRDLSVFQIGWRFLKSYSWHGRKITVQLCPIPST